MHDSNDKWVRRFTTDATSKHKNGFTIYKITSYLFPLASPEAVTVVTVWKRYSDLQKLQRNMKKMHQDLYLKGVCPSYTKWGYFRRFDQEAIDDRRKCTQALLEFIALHPPLFTSMEFVTFFQSSYSDPGVDAENNSSSNIEAIRSSLLLPVEVIGPLEYQSSEDDSFSTVDSPSVSTAEMIDSTHRKNSIQSVNSRNSISTHPRSSLTNNEITGTVENVADVLMLQDPIHAQTNSPMTTNSPMSVSQISSTSGNNPDDRLIKNSSIKLNLPDLISFGNKVNMDISQISQISTDSSTDSLSFLDSMSHNLNLTKDSKMILKNDKEMCAETDLNVLREYTTDTASETGLTVSSSQSVASFFYDSQTESVTSKRTTRTAKKSEIDVVAKLYNSSHNDKMNGSKDAVDSASCVSSARSCSRMDSLSMDSIFGSSSDLKTESYVFEAGYLLSLGARHEAKGDYQKAFDFYKAGIEKMLIGAQDYY